MSVHISDLVNRILESFSTAILFQCMDLKEENILRFAFRVHSKYGNNVIVINEDMAFCYACNKSIKLNKSLQMVNVDEHVKRHKFCKENDLFGVHLWAMGTHVEKLMKKNLLASFERISGRRDDEIREPIRELYSMAQDILCKVDGIIKLLSERPSADSEMFRELLGDVKKLVKPWNSYEELRKSADTHKRVEVVTSMENIDEASALLFFTTAADALSKDHVFYQETHCFLWESFNKGRLTNFCEKYKTLFDQVSREITVQIRQVLQLPLKGKRRCWKRKTRLVFLKRVCGESKLSICTPKHHLQEKSRSNLPQHSL